MLDVNRDEVVEVLDVSFSPPDCHLGSSVNFVVLPYAEYRGMVAKFLWSTFCVTGLCMVFLPLNVRAFSLVPAMLHDCVALSELQIWL